MDSNKTNVADYYDNFSNQQINTGINLRHRTIFHILKKSGLKRNHRVLEIGCGIGTITGLLSKYLMKGSVTGIDISPQSINYAKSVHTKRKNIHFITGDINKIELDDSFDFIVLPDVLEHIPEFMHENIFNKIYKYSNSNSKLFIHIPSPRYQEYLQKHKPELLQVIDQAVEASSIISKTERAGFELLLFKRYSLNIKQGDYHQMLFKRNETLSSIRKLPYARMVVKELTSKLFLIL